MLVFIVFQFYQQKYMVRPVAKRPAPQVNQENPESKELPPPPITAATQVLAPSGSDTTAVSQKRIINSGLYRATLDNKGAVLTNWQLHKYKSSQGQIFEMVAVNQGDEYWRRPGSLIFKDPGLTALANKEFYEITEDGNSFNGTIAAPATIAMKLKRGDLEIEKRFEFDKDHYLVNISFVAQKGGKPLECQFFLGQDIGPEAEHITSTAQLEAVSYQGGKVKRESAPKDPNEIKKIEGDIRWVGLDLQYFTVIAIPSKPLSFYHIQKITGKSLDGKETERDLLRLTTPVDGSLNYQIYLGPKNQSDLEAVKSADIKGVINYGVFSIIVLPLLSFLKWIHQYINNYGLAIIILTLILTLILFPFRLKQIFSMKKMQVVQPKVKAIQEKYKRYKKTDPKRAEMNQEVMALYKEHGVNPLGGCLPMILQIPILWAFYSMLQYSIELRQAPFIGYIQDLSAKDPYYVLPIIMGITMFISQKMTPMSPNTDPTMSKMMLIMPVFLTWIFKDLSSGLNLYFLCSNILQVAFQKIAERWMGDGKARAESKA